MAEKQTKPRAKKSAPLMIRFDEDELDAIEKLAAVEGVSVSDFLRQAVRLGVAAGAYVQAEKAETERRLIDRLEHRSGAVMLTQCLLMLRELTNTAGEKSDALRQRATSIVDDLFADGDALEQALLDIEKERIANLLGEEEVGNNGQSSSGELGMVRPVVEEV